MGDRLFFRSVGLALLAGGAAMMIFALALLAASPAHASYYVNCGNPPNWSGKLLAHRIGCPGARKVFKHVRCSDSACTEIHSGRWACDRHRVGGYSAAGTCHLGNARIHWRVYE